jgi:hypothetical protein
VVAAVAGPTVMRYAFGDGYALRGVVLLELGAATCLYMVGSVLGQTLIAMRRYTSAGAAWASGVVVMFLLAAMGRNITVMATHGFFAGVTVSTAVLGALVLRSFQRGVSA